VIKQAILTQTGAATRTAKFVAVADVIPASTALNGSIDELKHSNVSRGKSRARSGPEKKPLRHNADRIGLAPCPESRNEKNRIVTGHSAARRQFRVISYRSGKCGARVKAATTMMPSWRGITPKRN
jgi:hypothetical protein